MTSYEDESSTKCPFCGTLFHPHDGLCPQCGQDPADYEEPEEGQTIQQPKFALTITRDGAPGTATVAFDGTTLDLHIGEGATAEMVRDLLKPYLESKGYQMRTVEELDALLNLGKENRRPGPPQRQENNKDRNERWRSEARRR